MNHKIKVHLGVRISKLGKTDEKVKYRLTQSYAMLFKDGPEISHRKIVLQKIHCFKKSARISDFELIALIRTSRTTYYNITANRGGKFGLNTAHLLVKWTGGFISIEDMEELGLDENRDRSVNISDIHEHVERVRREHITWSEHTKNNIGVFYGVQY